MTDTVSLSEAVILPEHATTAAVSQFYSSLLKADGKAVDIDASKVTRLGALVVQVILAAEKKWAQTSQPFKIISPSSAFMETGKRLGLSHLLISESEAEFS